VRDLGDELDEGVEAELVAAVAARLQGAVEPSAGELLVQLLGVAAARLAERRLLDQPLAHRAGAADQLVRREVRFRDRDMGPGRLLH